MTVRSWTEILMYPKKFLFEIAFQLLQLLQLLICTFFFIQLYKSIDLNKVSEKPK